MLKRLNLQFILSPTPYFLALQETKQALENIGIDNHLQSEIFKV